MKKVDLETLKLCEMQGKLFAMSKEAKELSIDEFVYRLTLSSLLLGVDLEIESMADYDADRLWEELSKEKKALFDLPKEVLYWIGFIFRYGTIVYGIPTAYLTLIVHIGEYQYYHDTCQEMDPEEAFSFIMDDKWKLSKEGKENPEGAVRFIKKYYIDKKKTKSEN